MCSGCWKKEWDEMSKAGTHDCAACGGTGQYAIHEPNFFVIMDDNSLQECRGYATYHPCPVCLGAGRFSDQMPASDAVADAETLRSHTSKDDYTTRKCREAECQAFMAVRGASDFVTEREINACRDAFRAVPGLRESQRGK